MSKREREKNYLAHLAETRPRPWAIDVWGKLPQMVFLDTPSLVASSPPEPDFAAQYEVLWQKQFKQLHKYVKAERAKHQRVS